MIVFAENEEIDKLKWDFCIKNSVNGIVYAYSWYLDIVAPGWGALIEGDYKSVMPVPQAEKYGFKYIYPPPFTQQLGVFSVAGLNAAKVKEFIDRIPARFRYVEFNLNTMNVFTNDNYESRMLVTHLLDLIRPYTQIFANYSTQTKRNLRKAIFNRLDVIQGVDPAILIDLFRKNRGREFKQPASYYQVLDTLIHACLKRNMGKIWGVSAGKNDLCAGAFYAGSNKREIFLFSGVNEQGYEMQAMTFLIDRFIRSHSERELTLDFEGSLNKDIARFYRGFGSQEIKFLQIRKNSLPLPVKWIKDIQFRKRTGKLPQT